MYMVSRKAKKWIIVLAVIAIILAAAFFAISHFGKQGTIAVIRVNGEIYEKIDLDAVTVAYEIEINTKYGYNKLKVDHGSIAVIESDCRDHICMDKGAVSSEGVPIICLPHRLTIVIEGDNIDA